ncbi:mitochondrial nucleoid-associated protein 1 [Anguilla rostrata]|uniref:mitochondrial nucleoid-associated protein 1 n=1 Tax=Anguilla rostrata TaxID=7938 RepID=UPI0030D11552
MSPDERSEKGPTETCPFCGRSFKRLKSHITHCKMAPVTKATKTPEWLSAVPSAPGQNSAKKPGKLPAKREGQAGGTPDRTAADARPGAAGLGERVKARPNKKSPKAQDVPPGSGVKVKVKGQEQNRRGAEGAEPQRGRAPPVEHPHVRGATFAPSELAGKRPGPITTAAGGPGSYAETPKAPLPAPSKAATPGRESSPAKPPIKPKAPESQGSRGSAQFPALPGGGATAQSSSRDPFVARIQVAEGALRRPPRARTRFWEDVPSADQLTLRTGSSSGRGWTKTSVWEHIKEGFSCRSPAPAPKTPAPSHTPIHTTPGAPGPSHTSSHTSPAPALGASAPAPSHTPTLASAQDREIARLPTLASAQDREIARLPTLTPTQERGTARLPALTATQERETARLPTLTATQDRGTARLGVGGGSLAGSHAPPRGVERRAGRGIRCPLGLEGTPELAAAYEGIGLSMLPVRSLAHTEHVQQKALPTQLPALGSQGSLTDRVLMEVRLAELPAWFTSRSLLTPREAVAAVHRGWRRYYGKYIDVRRGGVGGVAMLLAGYCVLSYLWSYPHLKRDRWRKYH